MNLGDGQNIAHYRVTSYGGGAFDLYNRDNGNVFSIKESEYRQIIKANDTFTCRIIEEAYSRKTGT